MENQDYKNKNIERKYLENIRNNQFLRVKGKSLLELEERFYGIERDRIER